MHLGLARYFLGPRLQKWLCFSMVPSSAVSRPLAVHPSQRLRPPSRGVELPAAAKAEPAEAEVVVLSAAHGKESGAASAWRWLWWPAILYLFWSMAHVARDEEGVVSV